MTNEPNDFLRKIQPVFDLVWNDVKRAVDEAKKDFFTKPKPQPTVNTEPLRERYGRLTLEERVELHKFHQKRMHKISREASKHAVLLNEHPQYIEYAESKAACTIIEAL